MYRGNEIFREREKQVIKLQEERGLLEFKNLM